MRLRSVLVVATAAATVLTGAVAAQADDVSNSLDTSIDATAEVMPLTAGGATGSTTLRVVPRNGDGNQGCNFQGNAERLVVSVNSSAPTVATVSPSSLTFENCSDTRTVTVTPLAAGSSTVSLAQVSNNSGGSFDLAPATFRVDVTAATPTNTPPTVAVAGVATGSSYAVGSVPAATCAVTDAEDGPSTFPAALSPVSGPYAADGIGEQTATCSYTDAGGLTAVSSATYAVTDPSAPTITSTLDPATPDGDEGWYRSDVALDWTVTEAESPSSLTTTGCADTAVTADQQATEYTCSASSAGGSTGPVTVSIKRDATAPSVSAGTATGALGANGWYVGDVTVPFSATDATSGPALQTSDVVSSGEGAAVAVESPAFADVAGNTTAAGAVTRSFAVDLTDPTAAFDGSIGTAYFGSVPEAPTCTASDAVSGPAGCVVTGYSTAVGTHTLTATATDVAGRTGTTTQTYEVKAWTLDGFYKPVDMNGVWNTVKNGSTVPLKFRVFAGPTELTSTGAVRTFTATAVSCTTGGAEDAIEELSTTGGTSLRYDTTGAQFVQNWQTPKKAGACYRVTMTTQDGSTISALFKLK